MTPVASTTNPRRFRATKIIATLGPATASIDVLCPMIAAGVDTFRLNFSHVRDVSEVAPLVELVREAAALEGANVGVLGDLCGPKMRLRYVPEGGVHFDVDDKFLLYPVGNPPEVMPPFPAFAASVPSLCTDVRPGERVLIDDGKVAGIVDSVSTTAVSVVVTLPGVILDRKGVNLPDTELSSAALTPKDRVDVAAGVAAGVDMFALSFVRTAADVSQLRELLPPGTPVVAKIERPEAVSNFDEIVEAADGVMVARGDLGVEVGWDHLPGLQMDLVEAASSAGKLAIVATEMMESMTKAARPTRAEVSDVAGAVMDGASAVMLSAETSVGVDPVLVVSTMASVLSGIESHNRYRSRNIEHILGAKHGSEAAALAAAATHLGRDTQALALVVVSNTGGSARLVSAARPNRPVVALCHSERSARRLSLWWGVCPRVVDLPFTDTELVTCLNELGVGSGTVVVVEGPPGSSASDRVRLLKV